MLRQSSAILSVARFKTQKEMDLKKRKCWGELQGLPLVCSNNELQID